MYSFFFPFGFLLFTFKANRDSLSGGKTQFLQVVKYIAHLNY